MTNGYAWYSSAGKFGMCPALLLQDSRLNPRQIQVFLALALHAHPKTGICYVSLARLAEIVGLASVSDVSRAISALEKAEWLSSQQRFNRTNLYTLRTSKSASKNQRPVKTRTVSKEDHTAALRERGAYVEPVLYDDLNIHDLVKLLSRDGQIHEMTYLELARLRLDCFETGVFDDFPREELAKHFFQLKAMGIVTEAQVSAIENA